MDESKKVGLSSPRTLPEIPQRQTRQRSQSFDAQIVANTQAFLVANLARPELWNTKLTKGLGADMRAGYPEITGKPISLPETLRGLKDPTTFKRKVKLGGAKTLLSKWKRADYIFSENKQQQRARSGTAVLSPDVNPVDKRNRRKDKAKDASNARFGWFADPDMLQMQAPRTRHKLHTEMDLITSGGDVVDAFEVSRQSKGAKAKKGSDLYSPIFQRSGKFSYDDYDYEKMKRRGFAEFTDPHGVNFGAGPSGTIGDTMITAKQLASRRIDQQLTGLRGNVKKAKKREVYKELASAAIGSIGYEGHHSLAESMLPLEKPLALDFSRREPPEKILYGQIMPSRLQKTFNENYKQWATEQFPNETIRQGVVQRLEQVVGLSEPNKNATPAPRARSKSLPGL